MPKLLRIFFLLNFPNGYNTLLYYVYIYIYILDGSLRKVTHRRYKTVGFFEKIHENSPSMNLIGIRYTNIMCIQTKFLQKNIYI